MNNSNSNRPKHTPGPWVIERVDKQYYDSHTGQPSSTLSWMNIDSGGRTVASAHSFTENMEANARLIAAAPEMLEALQEIERGVSTLDAARIAAKAIAKATGGEE